MILKLVFLWFWLSAGAATAVTAVCQRIVSLAPSATEVAVRLGLGDKVVGVSSFDTLPEVVRAERIGGLYDASLERIVRLRPSLILALPEHGGLIGKLKRLPSRPLVLVLDHQTLAGIDRSLVEVGDPCGLGGAAADLQAELADRRMQIKKMVAGRKPPRVLVVVGRGAADDLFISGKDGYYHDLLELAGGASVYDGSTVSFPNLGAEGILRLNPDAVIEVVGEIPGTGPSAEEVHRFWSAYPSLAAVKSGRIYILRDKAAIVPGPDYIDLAEKLAQYFNADSHAPSAP